ncbi:His/Gly/Thr/Pro-type tRNA ligase C-terminal domain-containing protein, partial [Gammaproteobacteria bacterium]|nr:His/Gly/Thr/Pro-type tRNA ligase C-terminal domain-containing protein [Gammaproteobacteria bacterium]
ELVKIASDLKSKLQKLNLGRIILENTGNIGKGYRRHDEIGTPLCITIDFDSIEDNTATLRDRDTMSQERMEIDKIPEYLIKVVNGL